MRGGGGAWWRKSMIIPSEPERKALRRKHRQLWRDLRSQFNEYEYRTSAGEHDSNSAAHGQHGNKCAGILWFMPIRAVDRKDELQKAFGAPKELHATLENSESPAPDSSASESEREIVAGGLRLKQRPRRRCSPYQ